MTGTVQVTTGQQVTTANPLARMDSTGNVTGRHLHLECSTTQSWQCSTFLNPCTILGIPNIDDTVIHYDGTVPPIPPEPPTPTGETKKSKFPWAIYSRKLRQKY